MTYQEGHWTGVHKSSSSFNYKTVSTLELSWFNNAFGGQFSTIFGGVMKIQNENDPLDFLRTCLFSNGQVDIPNSIPLSL